MSVIKVGTDSEVFVVDEHGEIVSAIDMIGGSKENPLWVEKGNLQEDNVLAEFAINPAEDEEEFVGNIQAVYGDLKKRLASKKLSTTIIPFHQMDAKFLSHPKAMEFGCSTDMSAHTHQEIVPPNAMKVGPLRTAGGHIHVEFTERNEWTSAREEFVQWLDVFLGAPLTLVEPEVVVRRQLYGQAGAYRPKDYGLEYRSLSSYWLQSEELIRYVYRQIHRAHERFVDKELDEEDRQVVAAFMNTGEHGKIGDVMDKYRVEVPNVRLS